MANLTIFFRRDPVVLATIIGGAPSVTLRGFDPADLQEADWAQPGLTVVGPNPTPGDLADAIARKSNQQQVVIAAGWILSLCAACAITYVLTAR